MIRRAEGKLTLILGDRALFRPAGFIAGLIFTCFAACLLFARTPDCFHNLLWEKSYCAALKCWLKSAPGPGEDWALASRKYAQEGADSIRQALSDSMLATMFSQADQYTQANRLYEEASNLLERAVGPLPPDSLQRKYLAQELASCLLLKARCLIRQEKLEEAGPICARSIEISQSDWQKTHDQLSGISLFDGLALQANIQARSGDKSKALLCAKQALDLRHSVPAAAGTVGELKTLKALLVQAVNPAGAPGQEEDKNDFLRWAELMETARRASKCGDYSTAQKHSLAALALAEKSGRTDMPLAQNLVELAYAYKKQGNYAQAEKYSRRAAEVWEQLVGVTDLALPPVINLYADCLIGAGKFAQAAAEKEKAGSVWAGFRDPYSLDMASAMYMEAGHYGLMTGDLSRARRCAQAVESLCDEMRAKELKVRFYRAVSSLYQSLGDRQGADRCRNMAAILANQQPPVAEPSPGGH